MSGLRRIIGNTLISLFGQFVTWTSTLGLTVAYGRFLGDFKFGELYFAITFVSLIGLPIEFGFNQQLTRDVAEKPEKAMPYLWNALLLKTLMWLLLYGVMLLLSWALGYSQEQWTVIAICGVTLFSGSVVNTFAALHCAFERTVYPSVGMMLEKGLSALIGFLLLKNGASVETMALVLLGGSLVDALWVAFWFFRLVGKRLAFDRKTLGVLLRHSIPFIIYGVLGVIYYRIDTILLSFMASTEAVGWYGAGYRLFDTLLFIPNLILNAAMYPVFSRLASTSRSALKTAVEKCMNLLLVCAFPIAAFLIADAYGIIGVLYHSGDFIHSAPVVQALAPGLIFLYINTLFSSVIVSTRGEKKIPLMAAAALVFNLVLNLVLIPHFAQTAAAAITSLTELLLLCISAFFVPRHLLPTKSLKVGLKTLIAAASMGAVIFYLQRLSVFLLLPLGTLLYISITTLLRTIPRSDLQSLLKAVKGKGERSSVDTLTSIAEENIYTQITDPRLPSVKVKRVLAEARIEYVGTFQENQVTQPLHSVDQVKTLPLPSLAELSTLSEVSTLPITSVSTKEPPEESKEVLPSLEEDDDVTLRLPSIRRGKKTQPKTTIQIEGQ